MGLPVRKCRKRHRREGTMKKDLKNQISRRDFIKGAAAGAVGVATMGILGACTETAETTAGTTAAGTTAAGTTAAASTTEAATKAAETTTAAAETVPVVAEGTNPWEIAPDPVDESKITETIETDVLIIGAGYAGCATAASAAENGAKCIVIDKMDRVTGHGVGGTGTVGSKIIDEIVAGGDSTAQIDKPFSVAQWLRACGNRARESLVAKFFNETEGAMNWLIDMAEADGGSAFLSACNSRSVTYPEQPAYHMIKDLQVAADSGLEGMDQLAAGVPLLLKKHAEDTGNAEFNFNVKAEYLEKDGNKVVGAICSNEDGYVRYTASKGVVLATGDIAGDADMLHHFAPIGEKVYNKLYTPVGGNTGDGHKMGLWAGGSFQDGPWPTMMHPQACATFHGPFLFVNPEGERFMNEATWVQGKCLGIMLQGKSSYAWSIFDANWKEDLLNGLPYGGGMFWDTFRLWGSAEDEAVERYKGVVEEPDDTFYFSADTLEELAEKIEVPYDQLEKTVTRYNELCDAKDDKDFYKETVFMTPVKEGPFYATKVGAGLLAVVGGLHISDDFEVLNENDEAVPGLYAVGNVSGDLYATDYPINIPGNSHGRCLCWGKLAGEALAAK